MSAIELYQASSADAPVVADLIFEAFPDKFGPILGDSALSILHEVFESVPVELTTNTTLAETDGETIGVIRFGYGTSPFIIRAPLVLRACRRHFGRKESLTRYLKLMILEMDPPRPADELYLKTIGVAARCRGQGIGTRLVEHAEARARTNGCSAMSLLVMADNHGAIRLYQRLGFDLGPIQRSRILHWAVARAGFRKMIKTL